MARPHQQHVPLANDHARTRRRRLELRRHQPRARLDPLDAQMARHVQQHAATHDPVLEARDRAKRCAEARHRLERRHVVVQTARVRAVAQRVHMRDQLAVVIEANEILVHRRLPGMPSDSRLM